MPYTYNQYNYLDEIDQAIWSHLIPGDNNYFKYSYLKAFEEFNSNEIKFYYLVIYRNAEPVSFAIIQVLEFDFFLKPAYFM